MQDDDSDDAAVEAGLPLASAQQGLTSDTTAVDDLSEPVSVTVAHTASLGNFCCFTYF